MKDGLYNKFTNDCKKIIKNNDPKKSIDLISNIRLTNNSNIGNNSINIYNKHADESVNYDKKLYKNNINKYKEKVDININIAKKAK